MKSVRLISIVMLLFGLNPAFAFERGDNGFFCYTYKYWWDVSNESAYVVIEDISSSKYKVKFLEDVYNSDTSPDYSKGEYAWVWKSDVKYSRSACGDD